MYVHRYTDTYICIYRDTYVHTAYTIQIHCKPCFQTSAHSRPISPTGRPKLMAEMPGSGAFKTSPSDAELPSCLKELSVDLNDACG